MRHTFHRPLWSAFHFYLYLPPLPSQPRFLYIYIYRRSAGQRCTHRARKTTGKGTEDGEGLGGKGMEESLPFPPDILRHFVSNPKVEGVGASPGIGPYSTFMALNRDEVSTKLPSLPTFFSFFPSTLSHPLRSFDAYTRFFFETGMPRSENDLSLIYSLYSFIYLRRRARV